MREARGIYERMGFTVPPRGSHQEWGTGNWCIMFPHDYLELRGVVDPKRHLHGLEELLARREGLMGVAFSSDTLATTVVAALRAKGLHPADPRELTRTGWIGALELHHEQGLSRLHAEQQDAGQGYRVVGESTVKG